jgi:hypothetical protein
MSPLPLVFRFADLGRRSFVDFLTLVAVTFGLADLRRRPGGKFVLFATVFVALGVIHCASPGSPDGWGEIPASTIHLIVTMSTMSIAGRERCIAG